MGYETKLYVVAKSASMKDPDTGKIFASVIASFDLCKAYDVSESTTTYPETDCYIYADDGNTKILEDCCGDPLKEIPVSDAVRIVESASSKSNYWRYEPCLALLRSFDSEKYAEEGIVVLHFGH